MQEAASVHAEKLGFGEQWLSMNRYMWVLIDLKMEFLHLPAWKDDVKIFTWPSGKDSIRAHREFEAHRVYRKKDRVPLSILDLLDNLNGTTAEKPGRIWVVSIPGIKQGGPESMEPDKLRRALDLGPDRTGAMGTGAKSILKMMGVQCDFESEVIDSSISETILGNNVLIFASGGMADVVIRRVRANNKRNNRDIVCEKLMF